MPGTSGPEDGLYVALRRRGMSRRAFLKFVTAMAGALALPAAYEPRIAAAVEASPRLSLVWLRGAGCGGNAEAFFQAAKPTVSELLVDLLSVDYLESAMASSGDRAQVALTDARSRGGYLAVIEGAIPTTHDGAACTVGGRAFADVAREVANGAVATIALGSCAFDGGLAAARGGAIGATGSAAIAAGRPFVTLPGCPVNVDNLAATVVHYLTFGELPPRDRAGRPLFAYGALIHNTCERRAHFEFGEFVLAWGDEGAQKGWCLYKMGCKGPQTFANCATVGYADAVSWPVRAGHGCIGCTMPGFWDAMGPAYSRLPSPLPVGPALTPDQLGTGLVGGVGALTVAHGAASYVRARRGRGTIDAGEAAEAGTADAEVGAVGDALAAEVDTAGVVDGLDVAADEPPVVDGASADGPEAVVAPAGGQERIEETAFAASTDAPDDADAPREDD